MKFDYCTILVNKEEIELLPLHLNSLLHYHPDDEFNIKICVSEDKEFIECCKNFPNADIEILVEPTFPFYGLAPGHRQVGYDCANRMDKLMQICTSEWVIMSHIDIVYEAQMFQEVKEINNSGIANVDVGLLGHHPHGVVVLNREAYLRCNCKFWPMGAGFVGKKLDNFTILLTGPNGIPPGERPVVIAKTDVGDILKVEMQIACYRVLGLNEYYFHIGGQGFYGKDVAHMESEGNARIRKQEALNRFKNFK